MAELAKVYEPGSVEERIYKMWLDGGYFHAEPDSSKKPFCIVIPPPNVTGALHIGHALDNTLQDILVRFRRMQGYAALWLPGTDHAGIATQNVVERELQKEGLSRHDLGREKFVERVWEWKEKYGSTIIEQLKRLGSSCDWSRERFTMDPGLSEAVRKVFVGLFNQGLIYRGNRIINWCPRCETALSDIEVNHEERTGELVRFRYPLEDGSGHITVATTRLETMLGDTGIAVHPDDERYKDVVGKNVVHPFDDRRLPIVAEDAVDPEFGTGAVKVTPAHDATDFEIGQGHDLPQLNIFNGRAEVIEAGGRFTGLERYEAREAVRAALTEMGLMEGTSGHQHAVGLCSRCGTAVEPWLSDQWFVKMRPLAEPAIDAVKRGETMFHPAHWTNVYLNWLEQIRDWCISRQLWWGHRIPVWYCGNGHVFAAEQDPVKCAECGSAELRQDPDVLDTWFSSQLWPFSTLGWPEKTDDLEFFYPTSVLVSGYEIIHLWVARMMMAGIHFMGRAPFGSVVVHGIVRDEQGRKMSKSLGNVIDPLELIDKYGTDALRFTLAEHATGQDMYLATQWVEGARNFANKLWNASRFVLSSQDLADSSVEILSSDDAALEDRWILSRLARTTAAVTEDLERFEIAAAAKKLYDFTWTEFCDWYIEAAKLRLYGEDPAAKQAVSNILLTVLRSTVKLLHPFMPFITEEIWSRIGTRGSGSIVVSQWPAAVADDLDVQTEERFTALQEVVSEIRRFKAEYNIPPGKQVSISLHAEDPGIMQLLKDQGDLLKALGRLGHIHYGAALDQGGHAARLVAGAADILIPLEGILDVEAERARLGTAIARIQEAIGKLSAKVGNEDFRRKAPPQVVEEQQRRLDELLVQQSKLVAQLDQLGR
ncbi:MAG: valine--tRNA ligase [Actinomycetota bacterium]